MGCLYVVPTPIGNLEDITLRALRILRDVPLILAEDTRHTRKLLSHYDIATRQLSYHQHNKSSQLERALTALAEGDVALVSDSGMPSVADPGFELIAAARDAGFEVDVLPGPSAVITGVVAAALPAPGFLFAGFLPRRARERRARLEEIADVPYSLVLYEAPHRLLETLRDIEAVLGDRTVVAARELSKVHQEIVRGSASALIQRFEQTAPRGEFTLVVEGIAPERVDRTDEAMDDLRRRYLAGDDRRAALDAVAATYGVSRNQLYRLWLEIAGK